MKVARVQAMAAKIMSREKNKRPCLVSLTKNLVGMASLISFKDLQERNGCVMNNERDCFSKPTHHGMGVYAGSSSSLYFVTDDVSIVDDAEENLNKG